MRKALVYILIVVSIIGLLSHIKGLEKDLGALEDEVEVLGQSINRKNIEINELNDTIKTIRVENENLTNDINEASKNNDNLKRENKKLKNQVNRGSVTRSTESKSNGKYLGVFHATAYTDNVASQGKWVGQTATGMKPQVGVIAVDPKVIPLGTKLYVEGYGNCIAGDTGGAIKGRRLDLFYNTQSEVTKFGRKDLKVYLR